MPRSRYLHVDPWKGYTESPGSAVRDEGEALSEDEQAALSERTRCEWEAKNAERRARREAVAWLRRLAKVEESAIEAGVDLSRARTRLRAEIESMERDVAMRSRRTKARAA